MGFNSAFKGLMLRPMLSMSRENVLNAGVQTFPQIYEPLQNFKRQKGEIKQASYWGSKNMSTRGLCIPVLTC